MPERLQGSYTSRTYLMGRWVALVGAVALLATVGLYLGTLALTPEGEAPGAMLAAVATPWAAVVAAVLAALATVTASHGARHWGSREPSGRVADV